MNLRKAFDAKGVYVFVMTPYKHTRNAKGKYHIDLAGLEKNISHFAGIGGDKTMVVCGGSGEIHSLEPAEVVDVASAAVAGVDGRCAVVCGVRGSDHQAARTSARLQSAGADALLIMPHEPVVKKGDRAVWARHQTIAKSIDIGFLPFRAPAQTLCPKLPAYCTAVCWKLRARNAPCWITSDAEIAFLDGGFRTSLEG